MFKFLKYILCGLIFFGLISCASTECREIGTLVIKTDNCETGYAVLGITGHPPECIDQKSLDEIRAECPDF
jgi:hypothetical protein